MEDKKECACGCGTIIRKIDKKGRKRYYSKAHHTCRPLEVRFWEKVIKNDADSCWPWIGALLNSGYGQIGSTRTGIFHQAHRLSWILHNGPIPNGLQCLHKCDNRKCVNPNHLWLGTNLDNVRDKVLKNRHIYGSKVPHAKLTDDKVRLIRNMKTESRMPSTKIAKLFGVCATTIDSIIKNRSWKHVT